MPSIGFTGTRNGMDDHQKEVLTRLLDDFMDGDSVWEFHHGGCIGADLEAHHIADAAGFQTHVHLCDIKSMQGIKEGDRVYQEKPPLERNQIIVKSCEMLIVAPRTNTEEIRSGTWATYRYAVREGIPTLVLWKKRL